MLLNGKCADRFKEWLTVSRHSPYGKFQACINGFVIDFDKLPEVMQYALIIDYMDSEGIYIEVFYNGYFGFYLFGKIKYQLYQVNNSLDFGDMFESRTEALKAAIEKGNQILNER